MSIYSSIVFAKECSVPLYKDGRPSASRYNPKKEATTFASFIEAADLYFVLGVAGAFHIQAILQRYPAAKVVAYEDSPDDVAFIKQNIPLFSEIAKTGRLAICTKDDLQVILQNIYLPALYPRFSVVALPSWRDFQKKNIKAIEAKLQCVLDGIKGDFVTQSRFGKIWQHNILSNLYRTQNISFEIPKNKVALVVGAGPSAESFLDKITAHRADYFVIATDTAFRALATRNIFCDVAITVDAQHVSIEHYVGVGNKNTLFVLDISINKDIVFYLEKAGAKVAFCSTGHPLASFVQSKSASPVFLPLSGGAGTVTHAAFSLALSLGFKKIEVVGADFAYIDMKTYMRGTYLSTLFATRQSRFSPPSTQDAAILLRSPLIRLENHKFATTLLSSYKSAFEDYIHSKGCAFLHKENRYIIENSNQSGTRNIELFKFDKAVWDKYSVPDNAFLPFVAYLEAKSPSKKSADFSFMIKNYIQLAKEDFLQYNQQWGSYHER